MKSFLENFAKEMDPRLDEIFNEEVTTASADSSRICLVGSSSEDQDVADAAERFNVPIMSSETGEEFIQSSITTYFILPEFEGPIFENIYKHRKHHR